jgi:hypothetical protein
MEEKKWKVGDVVNLLRNTQPEDNGAWSFLSHAITRLDSRTQEWSG